VDSAGDAYVTGTTASTDFPTLNAFQGSNHGGGHDDFLTKLSPSGSGDEAGFVGMFSSTHVVADDAGNVYLCGRTGSADFPVSANAAQPVYQPGDIFVTKLNTNLAGSNSLVYSTFLGQFSYGFAVDVAKKATVRPRRMGAGLPVCLASAWPRWGTSPACAG
jgi:hypothetical protein